MDLGHGGALRFELRGWEQGGDPELTAGKSLAHPEPYPMEETWAFPHQGWVRAPWPDCSGCWKLREAAPLTQDGRNKTLQPLISLISAECAHSSGSCLQSSSPALSDS